MRDTVANIHLPRQNIEQIEKNAVKPKALKRPTKKRKREDVDQVSAELSTEVRPEKKSRND